MKKNIIFLWSIIILGISLSACRQKTAEEGAEREMHLTETERSDYLERGKTIAAATFAVLSSKLQQSMQEGGVSNAIEYCRLNAYPLVDSLSAVHRAAIRRTSLKVRNPDDEADEVERKILETYAKQAAAGADLKPMVQALQGQEVVFFAPIRVNAFCLQCHGKPGTTIREDDYALIRKHYPADKAIGYEEGDLRGMWSIRFRAEQ